MKPTSLVVAVFLLAGSSHASTIDQLLSRIQIQEDRSEAVQFDYTQETVFENSGLVAKASGTAVLKKPSQMRLHQIKPEERLTVVDGKKTWMYTPAHKQVWISKTARLDALFSNGVLPLENVAETLRSSFELSVLSESTGAEKTVKLMAVPKDRTNDVRLELSFSEADWIPHETVYKSSSAKVVTRLSNLKQDPDVADSLFRFVPPAGTETLSF